MKMTTEKRGTDELLNEMGLSIESSVPVLDITDQDWQNLKYEVTLKLNNVLIITTSFRIGLGYVDVPTCKNPPFRCKGREDSMFWAIQKKPSANFIDKDLYGSVMLKLAKWQKVKPNITSFMFSLMDDGEAYFNPQSFEEWAEELGYDSDSIKAKGIWEQSNEIGRALAASGLDLDKVKELLEDY